MSSTPPIAIAPVALDEILALRDAYRREMNCMIVHDSWHTRGFTESYALRVEGALAGYGSVGGPPSEPKETVKEFYLRPEFRAHALPLFRRLLAASRARWIEAQTNDLLLSLMLFDCADEVSSRTILFADAATTALPPPGVTLRPVTGTDRARVFAHTTEPVGDWGLERDGELVATGGVLFHYNLPYADIFMEVAPAHRRQGLASYLVQELKRICREGGRVPGARCYQENVGSRRALERAGMLPCARIVRGRVPAT